MNDARLVVTFGVGIPSGAPKSGIKRFWDLGPADDVEGKKKARVGLSGDQSSHKIV
jgi:hypothetical protein